MKLFDDIVLFGEGKKQFTDFHLPGTELLLWQQFFAKQESDRFYKILLEYSPWQQRTRKMYDKIVLDPRLTAFFGREGNPWTPELLKIRERVESECKTEFNCVLLNYYRDGNDSVAWHSDTLPYSGKHRAIASVSFGETRVFKVRHKFSKDVKQIDIPLTHGSFLLMGETMQYYYEHHVPKTTKKIGPRINLTFRISDQ